LQRGITPGKALDQSVGMRTPEGFVACKLGKATKNPMAFVKDNSMSKFFLSLKVLDNSGVGNSGANRKDRFFGNGKDTLGGKGGFNTLSKFFDVSKMNDCYKDKSPAVAKKIEVEVAVEKEDKSLTGAFGVLMNALFK
jgi:hypothetical protein